MFSLGYCTAKFTHNISSYWFQKIASVDYNLEVEPGHDGCKLSFNNDGLKGAIKAQTETNTQILRTKLVVHIKIERHLAQMKKM